MVRPEVETQEGSLVFNPSTVVAHLSLQNLVKFVKFRLVFWWHWMDKGWAVLVDNVKTMVASIGDACKINFLYAIHSGFSCVNCLSKIMIPNEGPASIISKSTYICSRWPKMHQSWKTFRETCSTCWFCQVDEKNALKHPKSWWLGVTVTEQYWVTKSLKFVRKTKLSHARH